MTDLPIKDLQALRSQYVNQREDVKKSAELEERDLSDTDVAEMERLASEIRKVDVNHKVKREDAKIAESAVLAGEASRGEQRELARMNSKFSVARGLQALYRGKPLTGIEAEFTEEAVKEARHAGISLQGRLSIPGKALEMRDGTAGDFQAAAGNGSSFVPTAVANPISALYAPTTLEQAGALVLNGLTGNLDIPKTTTKPTISAVNEAAAPAADSGHVVGEVNLSPTRYSAYTLATEQLMLQGGPAVENLIVRELADSMAAKIESAAFAAILAAVNTAGDATENAVAPSVLQQLEEDALAAGVSQANMRVLLNPGAYGTLVALADVATITTMIDRPTNTIMGYPMSVAANMADGNGGGGTALVGDFSRGAVIGYFGGVDFVVNPYTLDTSHQVRISIHRYADFDALQSGALHARFDATA